MTAMQYPRLLWGLFSVCVWPVCLPQCVISNALFIHPVLLLSPPTCSERAEAEKAARAERQAQIRELLAELGELRME